jgi:hypothetical protein
VASDNPVVLDGERNEMVGFSNAEIVIYPISRHLLLSGTNVRIKAPPMNFNYFATMNTMMLLRAEAQAYSHIPDFPWMDETRHVQTDWQRFAKNRY